MRRFQRMSSPAPRARRRRRARARDALFVLVALALLPSCGGAGKSPRRSVPGAAEQLLTPADVNRYPEGSPERALLAWWRAAQYDNLTRYLESFDAPMRAVLRRSPKAELALSYFSNAIRTARPKILDVDHAPITGEQGPAGRRNSGERVTVYTKIEFRRPVGVANFVVTDIPRAFEMINHSGRWLLLDDGFVQQTVIDAFRRKASLKESPSSG